MLWSWTLNIIYLINRNLFFYWIHTKDFRKEFQGHIEGDELSNKLCFTSFPYTKKHPKTVWNTHVLHFLSNTETAIKNGQFRYRQHCEPKSQDEDNQTKTSITQKIKKMRNTDSTKNRVWTQVLTKGKQFPPCYSYSPDVLDITRCKQTQITSDCLLKMWIVEQTVFFCRC